ncbi:MAG TPA: hypothetical protein VNV66_16725 [Pilimelia sp.]|nr:hypothetical protein [Pilimelia sp.]
MESYAETMAALAGLDAERARRRDEVHAWYAGQCAAVRRAADEAAAALAAAEEEYRAARLAVEKVDAEAGHLWAVLASRLGHAARRLGEPPAPALAAAEGADPWVLLEQVRDELRRARHPRTLPGWAYAALVFFGVCGAGLTAALAQGLRRAAEATGGDLAVALPVLALIVALLGPVVGLVPAKALSDRRGATLDAGAVAVVLLVGLATAGGLAVLLG